MPFIVVVLGLLTPRLLIVVLWLFSTWFVGVFQTWIWPLLGFLFFPYTFLWYSIVVNQFAGQWSGWTGIVLLTAILADVSFSLGRSWDSESPGSAA